MAGEVLNMSDLTINKLWCKLKDLCFKTATKPYTYRYAQVKNRTVEYLLTIKFKNYDSNSSRHIN